MNKKPLEMSVGLFTTAISAAFVAGAAAVWVTAGMTWRLPGDGSGSNADWLAAYGTWAIGLGAILFTFAAHLQRKDEIHHAKAAATEERRTHVTSAVLSLADARCLKDCIGRFLSLPAQQRLYGRLHVSTKSLRSISKPAAITVDALKHMPPDASPLASRINAGLEAIRELIEVIEMDDGTPPNSGDVVQGVDLDICGDIAEVADELLQMCDEFSLMAMSAIGPKQG